MNALNRSMLCCHNRAFHSTHNYLAEKTYQLASKILNKVILASVVFSPEIATLVDAKPPLRMILGNKNLPEARSAVPTVWLPGRLGKRSRTQRKASRRLASVHKCLRICDLCKELAFGSQRARGECRSSYNSFEFNVLCRQFLESAFSWKVSS